MTKTTDKKLALQKRLKEIGAELKLLQKQFEKLKKGAREAVKKGHSRHDARKIDELRKKIGL